MANDILYTNPLLWPISQHVLQKIRQLFNFFLGNTYSMLFHHWPFIPTLRRQVVLLTYLGQLCSDGGSVSFHKHTSAFLVLLALRPPILLET